MEFMEAEKDEWLGLGPGSEVGFWCCGWSCNVKSAGTDS